MTLSKLSIKMDKEKILISALAIAISQRLHLILERQEDVGSVADWCVYHMHTGDFEVACDVLWQLGVSSPAFNGDREVKQISKEDYYKKFNKKLFPACFTINTKNNVVRLIRNQSSKNWPPIDLIIEAYLRVATDYGDNRDAHLPTPKREPFRTTHPDQLAPMEALVGTGHAKKIGNKFIWTESIALVMGRNWLWNETDVDWTLIDEEKILQQSQAILSSLEMGDMSKFRSRLWELSIAYKGLEIMQKWNGTRWSLTRLDSCFLTFDEAMAVSLEMDRKH